MCLLVLPGEHGLLFAGCCFFGFFFAPLSWGFSRKQFLIRHFKANAEDYRNVFRTLPGPALQTRWDEMQCFCQTWISGKKKKN